MSNQKSSSWRNPSVADQNKFHLVPPADDFQPTEEEEALVSMYQTIKTFERQAAKSKEQKAREKLAAKETEFKQTQAKKRKKRRKHRDASSNEPAPSGDDDSSVSEGDSISDEEEDEQTLQERRMAKLDALRDEVDEAKKAMVAEQAKEEKLRSNLLATNEDVTSGPSLKRRKLQDSEGQGGLIGNMKIDTPPHEFSEKLDLKPWKGKTLYPSTADEVQWTPPEGMESPNKGAFLVELEDFDIAKAQNGTGNNTVVVKFHAPSESKRFRYGIGFYHKFCLFVLLCLENSKKSQCSHDTFLRSVSTLPVLATMTLTVSCFTSTLVSLSEEGNLL
jgi:hypothetical protein